MKENYNNSGALSPQPSFISAFEDIFFSHQHFNHANMVLTCCGFFFLPPCPSSVFFLFYYNHGAWLSFSFFCIENAQLLCTFKDSGGLSSMQRHSPPGFDRICSRHRCLMSNCVRNTLVKRHNCPYTYRPLSCCDCFSIISSKLNITWQSKFLLNMLSVFQLPLFR